MEHVLHLLILSQERGNEEVEVAQIHGTPIRELKVIRWSKWRSHSDEHIDSTAGRESRSSRRSRQLPSPSGSTLCKRRRRNGKTRDDEEQGGHDETRSESRLNLLSACRDRSTSAWLHFPHVELMFLLFAFEGAVAAGVSALHESRCPWVILVAAAALVSRVDFGQVVCPHLPAVTPQTRN